MWWYMILAVVLSIVILLDTHSSSIHHTCTWRSQLPPGKYEFTVGGETSTWEEGKVLTFEDCMMHEVTAEPDDPEALRIVVVFNTQHVSMPARHSSAAGGTDTAYCAAQY